MSVNAWVYVVLALSNGGLAVRGFQQAAKGKKPLLYAGIINAIAAALSLVYAIWGH